MADSRGWLWWDCELQLLEQALLIFFRVCVARQNERAPVSRGQMHINHLQAGELLQNRSGCEPRRQGAQAMFQ